MTRFAWGVVLAVMSVGVLGLDIATGPLIIFPIVFVIPVGLAAWYLGRGAGLGFALFLVVGRLAIAMTVDAVGTPFWAAIVNAIIRLTVLIVVLELVVRAKHQRKLGERVDILESFLPICAFCKRIRDDEGAWQLGLCPLKRCSAAERRSRRTSARAPTCAGLPRNQ